MAPTQPTTKQVLPSDKRSRRFIHAYKAAALAVVFVGVLWGAIFAANQWWLLAAVELVFAAIGLVSWLLIRAGHLNAALVCTEVALLAFAIGFCLLFDVPSPGYPRVSHLFLPVLAILAYINYLRRKSNIQLAVIAGCLAAFVTFSSADLHFSFAEPIPDDIRVMGTWINSVLAVLMMCGGVVAMERELQRHKGMERQLRGAIRRNELELFYQPQLNRAGQVVGAEALLRWKHPQRGYIPPGEFITAAEDCGLMPLLGDWVLAEACRTLSSWSKDPVLARLTLAVNVSAVQFGVEKFDQSVLEMVYSHGIDPTRLKLELTESVVVSGMTSVVARMNVLRATGITFALDDFGTGYSSLSYLRSLPIRQLKIDRSFVEEALASAQGAALIKSIVQMGIELDLVVLAEGVETSAQHNFLMEIGCHEFQGYHFGRPVPLATFEDYAQAMAHRAALVSLTTERAGRFQRSASPVARS
ncbi:EAL domain-containing protein [Rhizobium sp. RU36D]|uniref:putative bifunctional diguanylate cyclase/phosphodiesterase n=1 Tax=Rhizobium sp. RU36D TaxID=1907415 RepID=UPI0009D856BC|nr:EAL domain-containing protein [Rhizobium sp. RU36D]SMC81821.1 EAL domain, c-di-GMP-specific phosphodiesterase class I (or its enzymatically inactive variant) [Rhizobium sp. RU36D]